MAQPTDERSNATPIPSITREDHESGEYKWNNNKCKVFLLYCNECKVEVNGSKTRYERRPPEREIIDLRECLEGWLGKDVVVFKEYDNFTKQKLTELHLEFQNVAENEKYDCFIFIFLTCGEEDRIFCWEGDILITNILEPIKKERSMALKPKLFFIQSGDERYKRYAMKIHEKGPPTGKKRKVPQEADIFIQHSIIPESLFPVKGKKDEYECIFLTALMETLRNASTQLDINKLSLKINAAVDKRLQDEQESGKTVEQESGMTVDFDRLPIPEVTSTLTKALYFPCRSSVQSQS